MMTNYIIEDIYLTSDIKCCKFEIDKKMNFIFLDEIENYKFILKNNNVYAFKYFKTHLDKKYLDEQKLYTCISMKAFDIFNKKMINMSFELEHFDKHHIEIYKSNKLKNPIQQITFHKNLSPVVDANLLENIVNILSEDGQIIEVEFNFDKNYKHNSDDEAIYIKFNDIYKIIKIIKK